MTRYHLLRPRAASAALALALTVGFAVGAAPTSAGAAVPTRAVASAPAPSAVDPDALNLQQWMWQIRNVIGDRPLNKIVMPGSHDAGSWGITDKTGVCDTASEAKMARENPQVAAAISITQISPITQQLNSGSRYLDLRLCKQGGKWYTYHGGPLGALFFDDPATGRKGEVDDIAQWIHDHPDEVVTIELNTSVPADPDPSDGRDTQAEDNAEAVELLGNAIGTARMADRSRLSPTSTYNQFMAAGANVVLLDHKSATSHGWDWPISDMESRNSYLENKEWGDLFEQVFKHLGDPNAVINLISGKAIERDEQVLTTDMGDPSKFFVLSGNVDSTLAIPDAAYDVGSNGMNYKPDGLPYMLYLARAHNIKLLEKIEGEWRYSAIAKNTNVVQIDFVGMGGHRADGSLIYAGDMSAAIIANNTPTTAPGTLLGTERLKDGSWTEARALPGAGGAPEFAGGERAVTAMPNGDVQFLAFGIDKHLYSNIRFANGTWQGWMRLNSDAFDKQLNGGPLAMTSTPDGTMQVLAVDKDGNLLHTLRRPNGNWQSDWGAVMDNDHRVIRAKDVSVTGLPNNSAKVLVYGKDGAMRLTERHADGTWDQAGWQTLPGTGNAKTFAGSDLSITATPDYTLQIAAVGLDGNVWHMTQNRQGINAAWGMPHGPKNQPMRAAGVSIAALPDGSAQLLAIGADGNTYHTTRAANGDWTPFGAVSGPWGRPLAATDVKITGLPSGQTYTLVDAR